VNRVKPKNTPNVISLTHYSALTGMRRGDRDVQGLEDNDVVNKRRYDTECKGFHYGKCGQQNQVKGMAMTLPVQQSEVDQCPKEGNIE